MTTFQVSRGRKQRLHRLRHSVFKRQTDNTHQVKGLGPGCLGTPVIIFLGMGTGVTGLPWQPKPHTVPQGFQPHLPQTLPGKWSGGKKVSCLAEVSPCPKFTRINLYTLLNHRSHFINVIIVF